MKRGAVIIVMFVLLISGSCVKSGSDKSGAGGKSDKIVQKEDGTISLSLEKAVLYQNSKDPSLNTAEWNFVVSKPGRYNVWLSSLTRDTMNLGYINTVKIDLNNDERLEAKPIGNKIIKNVQNYDKSYFRADSYMGSFYIQTPGEHTIQVISEKIISSENTIDLSSAAQGTMIMSVFLEPKTR
ncbi:MAG: hypothetical protein KA114_01665 [Bacteroidales bacterium]|nr:hypothetical protein [Bacteroidales bacterium]